MPLLFHCWGRTLCFCCMVLVLSQPAWFCSEANLFSGVIINLQGLPYFLYLQSPSGINYLITYFVLLLCSCHSCGWSRTKKQQAWHTQAFICGSSPEELTLLELKIEIRAAHPGVRFLTLALYYYYFNWSI